MKLFLLIFFIFFNNPAFSENRWEFDFFDCGIYEIMGELIESDGMNSKVKVHAGTKKEYILILKGPAPMPTNKIKEYYLYQFEVLNPHSGKNIIAKLLMYPKRAPFERLAQNVVKKLANKQCLSPKENAGVK